MYIDSEYGNVVYEETDFKEVLMECGISECTSQLILGKLKAKEIHLLMPDVKYRIEVFKDLLEYHESMLTLKEAEGDFKDVRMREKSIKELKEDLKEAKELLERYEKELAENDSTVIKLYAEILYNLCKGRLIF